MCDERERLIGYVYGECDDAERQAIARHVEECGTCRAEIGGLRSVRQDLLAWEVEGGPAVWRPFVAPVVVPWWKQVPGWAMAAAASLMFLTGAAGGLLTHTLLAEATPTTIVATRPGLADPSSEQRIIERLRAELTQQMLAAREAGAVRTSAAVGTDQVMRQVSSAVGEAEQRQLKQMFDLSQWWSAATQSRDSEFQNLKRTVEKMAEVVYAQGGGVSR